jgi:hypothetical protein
MHPPSIPVILYVLGMIAVVVAADVLFLQHHFWLRLIVNGATVFGFATFYILFLKHS